MNAWNPNPRPSSAPRRPDRRDGYTFLVAFVAALIVVLGVMLTSAQDAAGAPRPVPTVHGRQTSSTVRCTPILVHKLGTLSGCTDGTTRWTPKAA